MSKIEEKHPFGVRLFWVAVLVAIAAVILGIWSYRHFDQANAGIKKNAKALAITQQKLQKTNDGLVEGKWVTCKKSTVARNTSINNYKQEIKLYEYLHTQTENAVKAAKLVVASPRASTAAKTQARQRIEDDNQILSVVPHIVIPATIPPCGPDPKVGPGAKHQ